MHGKYIIEEAVRLRDRGKFSEAIQTLNKLNDANSKSAHVFSLIAHCHILNNDLSEALSFLNKAKEIDPSIPSIGWNEARLLLRQKNIPTALRIAQETNARFPNDSEGLGVLGSCLKASNQLEKSLECLNKALSLDPNYPEALINRGLIYLSQKNISACLIDLEAAFELKPNFTPIWPILINLKMERKEYAETIPIIRKMVSIEPNDAENFAKLALCHQHQKELNESVIAYKKAIELKPSFVEARNNLGMVLQNLGQFDEAKDVFSAGLEISSDFSPLFKNFGNLLVEMSEFEGALNAYNRAVEINNNDAETYSNIGNVQHELERFDLAVMAYQSALQLNPKYGECYHNLGITLREMGDINAAKAAIVKSLELSPNLANPHYELAAIQYDEGDIDGAISSLEKFEKLTKNENSKDNFKHLPLQILRSSKLTGKTVPNYKGDVLKDRFPIFLNRDVEPSLVECLYKLETRALDSTPDTRFGGGRCSKGFDLFSQPDPTIQAVASDLISSFEAILDRKVLFQESFFNILAAGGGTTPHNHLRKYDKDFHLDRYKYSFVYYLTVGDQTCSEPGVLKIYKSAFEKVYKFKDLPDHKILPKPGMGILMPADRLHAALYGGKEDRVMIGCNFYAV